MSTPDPLAELALALYNRPILFDKVWLDGLLAIPRVGSEAFFDFLFGEERDTLKTVNGVRVIDVKGPLLKQSRWLTSYEGIAASLVSALDDPDVRSILFDVDSGGGVVNGAFELSQQIFEARNKKPIHAVANDSAFSAAYAIASAADTLTVTATGGVGSVGVIATHVEHSKAEDAAGYTYTTVYSGARKNDFSTHEPLNKTAKNDLQAQVDNLRNMFADRVAKNRNIAYESVINTESATFHGEDGITAGLSDTIGSFDAALSRAAEAGGASGNTVSVAASIGREGNCMPDTTEEQTTEAAAVTDTPAAEVIDIDSVRSQTTADVQQSNQEVIDLCAIAGRPSLALGYISAGTSLAGVRKSLLDARAEDASTEIVSTEPQNATQNEHDSQALTETVRARLAARGITPEVI